MIRKGIEKATVAMIEAGVEEEVVIKMLQKYWDLRLSEATEVVENGIDNSSSDSSCYLDNWYQIESKYIITPIQKSMEPILNLRV